jgi:hypothetical protein
LAVFMPRPACRVSVVLGSLMYSFARYVVRCSLAGIVAMTAPNSIWFSATFADKRIPWYSFCCT